MKIYYSNIASIKSNLIPKVGVLSSFYGMKDLSIPSYCNSFFLDSGAFSAFRKNIEININDYISFVKNNIKKIDVYASLDNIISYKDSINNYELMIKNGLNPLPAFHIGEPFWVLDYYINKTDYIALGGIAKRSKRERLNWLNLVFGKYSTIKFHGFGIQDEDLMIMFPWKSIDSSAAHMQARYGGIRTPYGWLKINPNVNYKDLKWISINKEDKIRDWVKSLNLPFLYDEAKENSVQGTIYRIIITICYYEQLCDKINNSTEVFIPKRVGFNIFDKGE